jgi:ATP-dependent Lon protease
MANLLDIIKQKGVPVKNLKKRKKYSKDDDSVNLIFMLKKNESSDSDDYDDTSSNISSNTSSTDSTFTVDEMNTIQSSSEIFNSIHKLTIDRQKQMYYEKFTELSTKQSKHITEYDYFMSLSIENQLQLLEKLKNIHSIHKNPDIPFRFKILESSIPDTYKKLILSKYDHFSSMLPFDPSYNKLKQWIDTFMMIPFNQYAVLPIKLDDGIDACQTFMENAKDILDQTVYGLNDVKFQIMQFIGQHITNPTSVGSAIAVQGPMGTGKTTLIKEGISKILNRPFELIALGGATDCCYLEGHSYTYESSTYGKIVEILIKSKCMNPIIYFDELDKVSTTPKGQEIISILTHLIDTSQNDKFHDRYFSELEFDLSQCLFIFSYNDESLVNPILKDRMYTITVDGYDTPDKLIIANDYLIPSIQSFVCLNDIVIPTETIQYIIEHYTKEKGVRNLKRCIEIIYTKLNLYRLTKPTTKLFEEDRINVQFPFTVTIDIVKKLIKDKTKIPSYYNLYL